MNSGNTKHPGGRPLLFETKEELKDKIQEYFDMCSPHPEEYTVYKFHQKKEQYKKLVDGKMKELERDVDDTDREPYKETKWRISLPKTPTITGLALHLKTSRETLINYQGREEFFDTIKGAKDIIENHWENMLQGANVTGVIFNLKNNYKWQDKQEQEISNPDGSLNPYNALTTEELRKLAGK